MSMNHTYGVPRVYSARESQTTIRRVELPDVVAEQFVEAYLDETISLKKVPQDFICDYRFAASVAELEHVARKVIREDIRALELQAPPGVGKTTRFPEYLRRVSNERVIVLEPTPVLAKAQVASLLAHGVVADYLDVADVSQFRAQSTRGLVYTTPAVFLTYLRLRELHPERYSGDTSRITVLHDECHENDGSTYALRALWSAYGCIARYIKMSATTAGNSAESRQRHNTAQPLVVRKYPPLEECDITVEDGFVGAIPKPWSLAAVRSKRTLLFVEDDDVAKWLARKYAGHVPVGLLRRSDPYEAYLKVQRDLAKNPGMVVIVDSGYQSGYTFQIDVVVDFGVRQQTTDDGTACAAVKRRLVTASERRQRVERAGRYQPGIAYVPDEPADQADSILGPGEAGHAAAWFVLLGFPPAVELRLVAAEALRTADLPTFLASGMTWGLWARERYTSARGRRRKEPLTVAEPVHVVASPSPVKLGATVASSSISRGIVNDTGRLILTGDARPCESGREMARDVYTDLTLLARPELQLEVRKGNFLCLAGDEHDRGSDYAESKFAEGLACDRDGEPALKWLRREVLDNSSASLSRTSTVDKIMRWSVWLATWNYNEAADAIVLRRSTEAPGDALVSKRDLSRAVYLGGKTGYSTTKPWCAELRSYLISIYDRLMAYSPKSLYVIPGDHYIRVAARLEYHRYCLFRQASVSAHRRVEEVLRKARHETRARRHVNCPTVSSATTQPAGVESNLDDERFVEI